MTKAAARFLGLVCSSLAFEAGASASGDFEFAGPLRVSDQFLITTGTMVIDPLPLQLLEPGAWEAEMMISMANTFTRSESLQLALEARAERLPVTLEFLEQVRRDSLFGEPLFFIDGESLRTELRMRRGLPHGLEVEVKVPFVKIHGGWMDGFLEEFHEAGGFDQDGRFGAPKDESDAFLQLSDRDVFLDPEQSLEIGDPLVAIRGKRSLARRDLSLIWDAALKIPVGEDDRFSSSGSFDVSVQTQVAECRERGCRFIAFNLRHLGDWELLDLGGRVIPGLYAGWERRWRQLSWVVQLMIAGSPLDGIRVEDLHSNTWQLSGGLHWQIGDYRMTAVVTENVAHFENGPDLSLHLGVRRGF